VARAYFPTTSQLRLMVAFVVAALCEGRGSQAAFLPVFGSPPFVAGTGGYVGSYSESPIGAADANRLVVNDNGVAVGTLSRRDAARRELDIRAVRWSASEATELGHLGTDAQEIAYSTAFDINNAGTAVGGAVVGQNYTFGTRPVLWKVESTAATELDRPLGFNASSWAHSINDAGDAVGFYSFNPVFTHAALWRSTGTAATPLTEVSGFNISDATAINNAGTIIGQAKKPSPFTNLAVRWDTPGVATLLGHLGPNISGSTTTTAITINDAGVIAGSSSKHDGSGNSLGAFAVRWEPLSTTATELQNPWTHPTTGQSEAHVTAINTAGTVVGYANQYASNQTAALRWDPGGTVATILANLTNPLDFNGSAAHAINADGNIVGFSRGRAAYWRADGTVVDLNSLIDPSSGWRLENATSISDTGWIAGYGWFDPDGAGGQQSYPRLFLIQIPEPTSLLSVGIGTLIISLVRWPRAPRFQLPVTNSSLAKLKAHRRVTYRDRDSSARRMGNCPVAIPFDRGSRARPVSSRHQLRVRQQEWEPELAPRPAYPQPIPPVPAGGRLRRQRWRGSCGSYRNYAARNVRPSS
jgi:uncharacterized membrane protein